MKRYEPNYHLQIQALKWTGFKRIGLTFLNPYQKTTKAIRADIKIAQEENSEADNFIQKYAREYEWDLHPDETPF